MNATADIRRSPSALSPLLADVALIDAEACATAGGMSVSWWHNEVLAGRAPKPAVQRPRCTRWRLADVREFWQRFADAGAIEAPGGTAMKDKLAKASAKARAQRASQLAAA